MSNFPEVVGGLKEVLYFQTAMAIGLDAQLYFGQAVEVESEVAQKIEGVPYAGYVARNLEFLVPGAINYIALCSVEEGVAREDFEQLTAEPEHHLATEAASRTQKPAEY
jgi:hypothetical protein